MLKDIIDKKTKDLENKRVKKTDIYDKDSIERLWGWILHEDTLFANRINFFLLAESMFFAAFAALTSSDINHIEFLVIVGTGGIILATVWIYISWYQIYTTMRPIKTILVENLP